MLSRWHVLKLEHALQTLEATRRWAQTSPGCATVQTPITAHLDDSAQQVGPELSVQGGHAFSVLQAVALLKGLAVGELAGLQEVQQGPQLLERVLQGRARDQQLVAEVPACQLLQGCSWSVPAAAEVDRVCTAAPAWHALSSSLLTACAGDEQLAADKPARQLLLPHEWSARAD